MLANALSLLAAALTALTATVSAAPANGPGTGPNGYPPADPLVQLQYSTGYYAYPAITGEYPTNTQTCLGLEGINPLIYVNAVRTYPDGRRAYKVRLYSDWACQGNILGDVDFYYDNGKPLNGPDGKPAVPKSLHFIAA
ncbi:hypothetical protein AMAG_15584 [Allomyces macrogynus ATCC 38327]|uniref:Uncharacterized protein n=1 Tax=Allomyces macrogynus (strain ATCC 38327) TaxID=578462 RepID=A0A0L0T9F5_ALLM3|nr:hypothetical protein AMAG_15584 [Allomyces macrogynus ATCC 38327]|eukprot:KNE71351.1 hypothetical protein AMAG_15584 [Allomyces macrogynus ATCC 38327]